MASSRSTLGNLPSELLLSISTYLYTVDAQPSYLQPLSLSSCANLCRTCRRLYDLLVPDLWSNIGIRDTVDLRRFYSSLLCKEENAVLVKHFRFSYLSDVNDDADGNDPSVIMARHNGELTNENFMLQFILTRISNVRILEICPTLFNPFESIDDLFRESNQFGRLEELHISGCQVDPSTIERFLQIKDLKKLSLALYWASMEWHIYEPLVKSSATQLILDSSDYWSSRRYGSRSRSGYKRDTMGVPIYIIQAFHECFDCLQNLTILIPPDSFIEEKLDKILNDLGQRGLKSLSLETVRPSVSQQPAIDFSTWPCLESLAFDSIILWPLPNSWYLRQNLSQLLPSSLKKLHIRFPSMVNRRFGNIYDGVYERKTLHPIGSSSFGYCYVDCTWVSTLLRDHGKDSGDSSPVLPNLREVRLDESAKLGNFSQSTKGRISRPLRVPPDLKSKFHDRNIKLSMHEIKDIPAKCKGHPIDL